MEGSLFPVLHLFINVPPKKRGCWPWPLDLNHTSSSSWAEISRILGNWHRLKKLTRRSLFSKSIHVVKDKREAWVSNKAGTRWESVSSQTLQGLDSNPVVLGRWLIF